MKQKTDRLYCLEYPPLLIFIKYLTRNMKQKTDREASQDNMSAREELGA